ncbi:tigger transposable element-derived protein 1-like [Calliphora vicina]
MLKPLAINKFLKPRALIGKDLKCLPVHWMANHKAWVTSAIFSEWFYKCFVPEVESYAKKKDIEFKILLLVDNAPGHPHLEHPNIRIEFLPPNTTSILQPQDQGIISTFKKHYIKNTYKVILNKIEKEDLTLNEAWKKFSIFDCILQVASAISEIKPKTLNACWKAVWPNCVGNGHENEISALTNEILSLAHQIGGEGFDSLNNQDLEELLVEEPLSDEDIINLTTNIEENPCENNVEETVEPLTSQKIFQILNKVAILENEILNIDPDTERAIKLQRGLGDLFSGYQELYKQLLKKKSQTLVTKYFQIKEKNTAPENSSPEHIEHISIDGDDDIPDDNNISFTSSDASVLEFFSNSDSDL